jgi:hypothetical protein
VKTFFLRLYYWLIISSVIRRASTWGEITVQQMATSDGMWWLCSIRSHTPPRYSWTGQSPVMGHAISKAISMAIDSGPTRPIIGKPSKPVLGGAEFDS